MSCAIVRSIYIASMDFRVKAFVQNSIDCLPDKLSYEVYYKFQRKFAGLSKINPFPQINAGGKILELASKANFSILGKRVLEVGTGRSPILPMSLWLHGASRVVTCDLNPYFKEDVWIDSFQWLKLNKELVLESCEGIDQERLNEFLGIKELCEKGNILRGLHSIGIDYLAPADARMLPFDDGYFDAHVSYNVLEHIPRSVLKDIFIEAKRLVRLSGVILHKIDYTDHFSHSDKRISEINFLRFNERDYDRLAGNKFMYMNRLRDDDFRHLWQELSLVPYVAEKKLSQEILSLLRSREKPILDNCFSCKSDEDLATTKSWYGFVL